MLRLRTLGGLSIENGHAIGGAANWRTSTFASASSTKNAVT